MTSAPQKLADGFTQTDRDHWRSLVAKALVRSKPGVEPQQVEEILGRRTSDGLALKPLYTAEDVPTVEGPSAPGTADFRRGALPAAERSGWQIHQRYWGTPDQISAAVADGLKNGVDSIWLTLLPDLVTPLDYAGLFVDIDLAKVAVTLEAYENFEAAATTYLAASDGELAGGSSLGLDPVGYLAGTGQDLDSDTVRGLASAAQDRGIAAFTIDGTVYHDAGASSAQELGAATAAGLDVLRELVDSGMTPAQAVDLIEFRFAVTDDQFGSIAKLRAARVLWSRVQQVAGVAQVRGQRQHAVTSWAMLTRRDPWVNLVRNTVAGFAGGVGGAAAVTVQPHDMAVGFPSELGFRMARNTSHLLLSESHVGVVQDPLGGSWYGEDRTLALAQAAWSWLQELEGAGGIREALAAGLVAERISDTRQKELVRIANRKAPLTGISEFPDADRSSGEQMSTIGFRRPAEGLGQHRISEVFEALRDRSDRAREAGQPPEVTLVTVGSLASYTPRLGFAKNLFAVAGITSKQVSYESGLEPERLKTSGRSVVCLCGSDADYANVVDQFKEGLFKEVLPAGASIWLAGKPGKLGDAYVSAGIDQFIFAGCDAVEVLESVLADLEVAK